jgi:hypothetical protein
MWYWNYNIPTDISCYRSSSFDHVEEVLAILASSQNFGLRKPKFCQRISHYYRKSFSEFWASLPCSARLDLDKSKAHSFLSIIFKQRLCISLPNCGSERCLASKLLHWLDTDRKASEREGRSKILWRFIFLRRREWNLELHSAFIWSAIESKSLAHDRN